MVFRGYNPNKATATLRRLEGSRTPFADNINSVPIMEAEYKKQVISSLEDATQKASDKGYLSMVLQRLEEDEFLIGIREGLGQKISQYLKGSIPEKEFLNWFTVSGLGIGATLLQDGKTIFSPLKYTLDIFNECSNK